MPDVPRTREVSGTKDAALFPALKCIINPTNYGTALKS
jgi:hypothetical protein